MKRRNFIGLTALAGAAPFLSHVRAEESAKVEPKEPVWVKLTKDVKVTRGGFGTGMRGFNRQSDLTRAGWAKAIDMLRYAYDSGIRLFDCADLYGTHFVVAEALKDKPRESYVLVSKVWMHKNSGLPEVERLDPQITVRRFLKELRTDYVDVVQLHCLMNGNWATELADAMEGLAKLKKEGLIRAHGISSHSNAATEFAVKSDWCDVIHVRINSEGVSMDGFRDDAAKRVEEGVRLTKLAHDAGKGIIAMKLIGEGKFGNDPALRKKSTQFVSQLDCVDTMVVGFGEKEHITEFLTNLG